MAASPNKTRIRLEAVKGGTLKVDDNRQDALKLQGSDNSDIDYLQIDSRTGQQKIILGESDAEVVIEGATVLNGSISGSAVLDQDDLASDSATHLATQQSIKAYVDAQITAQDLDFQGDSGGALSIDLDSEVLDIAGGTGISTAGSGNQITIDLDDTSVSAGSYGAVTQSLAITVDAQGRLTSAAAANIAIPSSQVTDIVERVEDVSAAQFSNGSHTGITVTYDDGDGSLDLAVDGNLLAIDGMTPSDSNIIVGNGSAFVLETGATARTSLGLGTGDNVQFTNITATGNLVIDGHTFSSVKDSGEPLSGSDSALVTEGAVKKHIESLSEGLDVKKSVLVADVGEFAGGHTYTRNADGTNALSPVTSGDAEDLVGQIARTGDPQFLVIDNILVDKQGARILVKEGVGTGEDKEAANGIYDVSVLGGRAGNSKLEFCMKSNQVAAYEGERIGFRMHVNGSDNTSSVEEFEIIFRSSDTAASETSFAQNGGSGPYELEITCAGSQAAASLGAMATSIRGAFGNAPFSNWTVSAASTGDSNQDREDHQDDGHLQFSVQAGAGNAAFNVQITQRDPAKDNFAFASYPYFASNVRTILKRSEDVDGRQYDGSAYSAGESDFTPGAFTFVEQGETLQDCGFVYIGDENVEYQNEFVRVEWAQFSSRGTINAGRGLRRVGNDIQEDLDSLSAITSFNSQPDDRVVLLSTANSGEARKMTMENFLNALAGTGMSRDGIELRVDANQNGIITSADALVETGALDAGSITSGFGSIDIGASALTAGLATFSDIHVDDLRIDGATIGHSSDADLLTLASGILTVAGEISVTTLDIGGTNVSATAAELNYLDNDDLEATDLQKLADLTASAAEINLLDAGVGTATVTIADDDNILLYDQDDAEAGKAKKIVASDLKSYVSGGTSKVNCTLSGAGLAADAAWNAGTNGMLAFPSGFAADNGAKTELYLNGMLLLRGSAANDADYYQDSGDLKFDFALEAGDVVQFVKRA